MQITTARPKKKGFFRNTSSPRAEFLLKIAEEEVEIKRDKVK
jgi:hypothetical protein